VRSKQAGLGFKFRRLRSGFFQVTELKSGGAAKASGLVLIGDTLSAVEGQTTCGMASKELADILLGPPGTGCLLHLVRGAKQTMEVRG